MATLVQTINTNILSVMDSTLGSTWQELAYVYSPELNSKRAKKKGYGAYPSAAENDSDITNSYTVNQSFNLLLMDEFKGTNDETDKKAVVFDLYDKMDEIIKQLFLTNVSGSAVMVDDFSIDEPEIFNEEKAVLMRFSINVKYRSQIA